LRLHPSILAGQATARSAVTHPTWRHSGSGLGAGVGSDMALVAGARQDDRVVAGR
jgi:hypothetical protein